MVGGADSVGATRPVRRGIVVVHGVGFQGRGGTLELNVEALARTLQDVVGDPRPVEIVAPPARVDGVSQAEIRLYGASAAPEEVWVVREAWWADSFEPSAAGTVLGWGLIGLVTYFVRSVKQAWFDQAHTGQRETGLWHSPTPPLLFRWLNRANSFVITACYFLAYLIGMALAVPLAILLQVPGIGQIPSVGGMLTGLLRLVTGGIGDQQAMTSRPAARAAAAGTVMAALGPFLDPDATDPCRTVTVIAHSGGCVVSFDALAGHQMRDLLADIPAGHPRRITWVTLGSGLNLAFQMRSRFDQRARAFFDRSIHGHVNWVDFYARHDPVPLGSAPPDLVAALVGSHKPPGGPARAGADDPRPYVSMRVVNADWPFSDHGGYWDNRAEVMARVVHLIADDRLAAVGAPSPRATPDAIRYGLMIGGTVGAGVQRLVATERIRRHRRGVIWRRSVSLLLILAMAWSVVTLPPLVGVGLLCGVALPAFGALLLATVNRCMPELDLLARRPHSRPVLESVAAALLLAAGTVLLAGGWAGYWRADLLQRSLLAMLGSTLADRPAASTGALDPLWRWLAWWREWLTAFPGSVVALAGLAFILISLFNLVRTAGIWLGAGQPAEPAKIGARTADFGAEPISPLRLAGRVACLIGLVSAIVGAWVMVGVWLTGIVPSLAPWAAGLLDQMAPTATPAPTTWEAAIGVAAADLLAGLPVGALIAGSLIGVAMAGTALVRFFPAGRPRPDGLE
jgi:hypothetical protein